jgi:hypothetical protein
VPDHSSLAVLDSAVCACSALELPLQFRGSAASAVSAVRDRLDLHPLVVAVVVFGHSFASLPHYSPALQIGLTRAPALARAAHQAGEQIHRKADAAYSQSHHVSVLMHGRLVRLQAPFFTRSCGSAAGSDRGAIDPPLLPIELTALVKGVRWLNLSRHFFDQLYQFDLNIRHGSGILPKSC